MKKVASSCFILSILCVFLYAKKFWEEKAYTEWTKQEAEQMFARSPWVKEDSITLLRDQSFEQQRGNFPSSTQGGGLDQPTNPQSQQQRSGSDSSMYPYPVRLVWVSELVRKAQVRLQELDPK